MTRKNNITQAFIGPLRQGESRSVVRQSNQNGQRTRKRRVRKNARMQAIDFGLSVPQAGLASQGVAAAYARGQRSAEPRMIGGFRTTNVAHRELVTGVTGSVAFTVANSFALNPGIAATFPWLSTIAQQWEQYKFRRLKFCYYTRTGTTTPGSILLCPDYDAADAAPATEQIASSYVNTVEEVPWTLVFECVLDPQAMIQPGTRKFVRSGPLAANLDIKTYDGGNLHLCTVDGTAVNWGKLWVEYDVDFFEPALSPTGSIAQVSQHITGTSVTSANWMGTQTEVSGSTVLATIAGSVLTFAAAGTFLVAYNATSATTVTIGSNVVAGAGASLITTAYGGNGYISAGNATATFNQNQYVSTGVGGTLTFSNTVVGSTTAELFIVAVQSTQQ